MLADIMEEYRVAGLLENNRMFQERSLVCPSFWTELSDQETYFLQAKVKTFGAGNLFRALNINKRSPQSHAYIS